MEIKEPAIKYCVTLNTFVDVCENEERTEVFLVHDYDIFKSKPFINLLDNNGKVVAIIHQDIIKAIVLYCEEK